MLMVKEILAALEAAFKKPLEQAKTRNWEQMGASDFRSALTSELRDQKKAKSFYVEEVFDDSVIVCVYGDSYEAPCKLLRFPYLISNGVASFGSPVEVERITTFQEVGDAENQAKEEKHEYQDVTQSESYKLDFFEDASYEIRFDATELTQAAKKGNEYGALPFKNAVLTKCELVNSKGHYYPNQVWQSQIDRLNELASQNRLVGEAEHPDKPSIDRQCIKFTQVWMEGNSVLGNGEILPTSIGKDIMVQAAAGIPIAISSRGYGTLKLEQVKGKKALVVQDDFHCVTFDAVWAPSAEGSYITEFGQSQQVGKTPLYQSQGDEKGMPPEIIKLLTQAELYIDLLKKAGKETKHYEDQLKVLEQSATSISAETLVSMLKPFVTGLSSNVGPADPDKNKGTADPLRMGIDQSASQAPQQLNQEDEEYRSVVREVLAERKLNELLQSVDEELRPAYREALSQHKDVKSLEQAFTFFDSSMAAAMRLAPPSLGTRLGKTEKEKTYEDAPKTVTQAVEQLVQDLEDEKDEMGRSVQKPSNPRWTCSQMLLNQAKASPYAVQKYLWLKQGNIEKLEQAGEQTTAGLVDTNVFMFPIIRRVYDHLIMRDLASIQPMSDSSGKIFYLDTYLEGGARADKNHYYNFSNGIGELQTGAKKATLKFTSETIDTESKKMRGVTSFEALQDFKAKFGIDAHQEVMLAVAVEIAREFNNQMIYDLYTATGTAGDFTFGKTAPSGYTQTEWNENGLWTAIQNVDNEIFDKRLGNVTHIIGGKNALLQLSKLGSSAGYSLFAGGQTNSVQSGYDRYGTLNNTISVIRAQIANQPWADNKLLFLRKGMDWKDTVYVFAPYVTQATNPKEDDEDFSVSQGLMSRAARKIVNPEGIAKLQFTNSTGTAL